jgi:hypothetical protein
MPSDLSTAIDIEHLCAISWTLFIEGALSCGIYRRVFEKNQGVIATSCCHLCMEAPLNCQGLLIFNQATSLKG